MHTKHDSTKSRGQKSRENETTWGQPYQLALSWLQKLNSNRTRLSLGNMQSRRAGFWGERVETSNCMTNRRLFVQNGVKMKINKNVFMSIFFNLKRSRDLSSVQQLLQQNKKNNKHCYFLERFFFACKPIEFTSAQRLNVDKQLH